MLQHVSLSIPRTDSHLVGRRAEDFALVVAALSGNLPQGELLDAPQCAALQRFALGGRVGQHRRHVEDANELGVDLMTTRWGRGAEMGTSLQRQSEERAARGGRTSISSSV